MGESFILTFVSLVLSVIIVYVFLPTFSDFTEKQLTLNFFQNPEYVLVLLGLALFVGLLAGSYPALFLAGFSPSKVLKGAFKAGKGHQNFRSVLVVGQFAISQ